MALGALARMSEAQPMLPAGSPPNSAAAMAAPDLKPVEAPDRQQVSLAFGNFLGRFDTNYLARYFAMDAKTDLDLAKLVEGFSNFMAGASSSMPDSEMTNLLNQQVLYMKGKVQRETKALVDAGPENKAMGVKFLEDNAAKPGVTRMANGAQYKVVKEGDGALPAANDLVTLKVSIQRIDGSEVAKIHYEFPMSNISPTISAVLPPAILPRAVGMMKAGSHWILYLPYDQAYGDQPAMGDLLHTPKVGPYSAMIFDTELEGVRPMPPSQTGLPAGASTPQPVSRAPIPQTSSDIVRVPSAEELKRGSNIEVMTLDQAIKRSQTNTPGSP
jgi:FKBP-type peptidyl-prolyl cis-trans isomerase FklB